MPAFAHLPSRHAETKASSILQFIHALGTWAAWLYDLLQPQAAQVLVCDPRRAGTQVYAPRYREEWRSMTGQNVVGNSDLERLESLRRMVHMVSLQDDPPRPHHQSAR
jgi:hypothetical protein